MNRKLNYLSAIPLYGTCFLLIYLFALSIKERISKKKFRKVFYICAIVSALCWYMIVAIFLIINNNINSSFLNNYGLIPVVIIGGYMMNGFVFTFVNKKWDYLSCFENEKITLLKVNKQTGLYIALALSGIICIIAFITLFAFRII